MITEQQYKQIADDLGIEVAVIKAVEKVESRGEAFLSSGEPKILFEPHVFWRELERKGINPNDYLPAYSSILNSKWKAIPYGKVSQQHGKLQKAVEIDRESALKSCSWGKFQIMGFNYKLCGYSSVQDFINAMYKDEYNHLLAFVNFIKSAGLVKYLKTKNWAKFAEGYNGKSYKVHKYDIKLENAYNSFS